MNIINIKDIDLDNTFFHFDVRNIDYINEYGLEASIGPNSINAEINPKIFFQ